MNYAIPAAVAVILLIGSAVLGDAASFRPGPEGDLLAWVVAGPLPNPGVDHESCKGFDEDYLAATGGEAAAAPSEGTALDAAGLNLKWRFAVATERDGLDFVNVFRSADRGVAYAYTEVVSGKDRGARLLLGSDDGVKVWVNGELRHTNHLRRGVNRDEDKIDIALKAGKNRLLFKVDQAEGGWGLMARLVNKDVSPVTDVRQSLNIDSNPGEQASPAMKLYRLASGKSGSLDVAAVTKYLELRFRTTQWVERFEKDADNPKALREVLRSAQARLESSKGASADAISAALADGADAIKADYDRARAKFLQSVQTPPPLVKTDIAKEDYVTVMPGGRYFAHADGSAFTPIGYNHNPDWSKFIDADPSRADYNPKVTEDFFAYLRKSGINLVRLMLETPASGMIENPLGTFRPEHVRWIDHLVTFARNNDIKLMITPWDTFWMVRQWDISPYNSRNGGPVEKWGDFITRREVIEAQKKRLAFIVDRWGNSGTVFAWELLNEAELYWEVGPDKTAAWAAEMVAFTRDYERKKWGRNHLVTVSIAHPMPTGALGDIAYRQPGMDLATTHLYIGASKAPTEPIEPALNIREGVTFALGQIKDNRPYIDGEDGPIDVWIADQKLDDAVFHNMTWAHLTSGGAGSGFRWPYRHPHHISEGMCESLSRMRVFADQVPWQKLTGELSRKFEVEVPDGWIACRTATSLAGVFWVAARDWKASCGLKIRVQWPDGPNKLSYSAFDTQTGKWIAKDELTMTAGSCTIDIPSAPASIAFVLE